MSWFKHIFSWLWARPSDAELLPPEVRVLLERHDYHQLISWLYRLGADGLPSLLPSLLAEAKRCGWEERDLKKLEIFFHYYHDNFGSVIELAGRYESEFGADITIFQVVANSLIVLGRFEDAYILLMKIRCDESAFASDGKLNILAALICLYNNKMTEIKGYVDAAWRLAPDNPDIAQNAYVIYFELGDMDAFNAVRRAYADGRVSKDQAGVSLASAELAMDHYKEGFTLWEQRYQIAEARRYLNGTLFDSPRWQGESLEGKTLLISAEQGLGDTIQMARYFESLEKFGANRIVIEAQAPTISLLESNFGNLEFVVAKGTRPEAKFDLWTSLMSLPYLFGTTEDDVPNRRGYLRVPQDNLDYWRSRVSALSGGRVKIGLAWSGRREHRSDRRRSIPCQLAMDAIRDLDVTFFALQTDVPEVHPLNLMDVSEEMLTLADTAALIAEMDLVITVDTSPVHVAGAIGKETWLLLPYRYEWRWSLEGEGNRWYDAVSVLRQKSHGDWEGLLGEVFRQRLPAFLRSIGGK